MIFLTLALRSLRNRIFTSLLTILSIALSVCLLLSVERTHRAAQSGFTQAVSQVDLLVGARTGPLNLILYTLFNMGSASNNISWETYQKIKSNPAIEWTIPYSLGDGHRGFRIIATDENFYRYYRFRNQQAVQLSEGKPALQLFEVVIGSQVADRLKYKIGDPVIISHGVTHSEGVLHHSDKPFAISGILKPTGTAIDQSLYISLESMEAIHVDWKDGSVPDAKTHDEHSHQHLENIQVDEITSFFVRTKSRTQTLKLMREINEFPDEPLLAVIPGVTLSELWKGLSQVEIVMQLISIMVFAIGMASMLSTLLTGLNERRREMSILRAIGASPFHLTTLLVFESSLLTVLGAAAGLVLELSGFFMLAGWLEKQFGFYVVGPALTEVEVIYFLVVFSFGTLVGLVPAIRASRMALKDGLSAKI